MNGQALARRRCLAQNCDGPCTSLLQCPTCLKLGIQDSIFCSQACFQREWATHKLVHRAKRLYDPFPESVYAGPLRAVYPLSDRRLMPSHIARPDYAAKGIPLPPDTCAPNRDRRAKPVILDLAGQAAMRKVCRLAREVLDIAAAAIRPGITTDAIDEIVHQACIDRESYPSPLNYNFFPKSVCTSLNEVICHGIPDQRVLLDGDILNLDVSLYHGGYHADLNETYYVGDNARNNTDCVRVIETARQCLDKAIATIKPGTLFRSYGDIIQAHADAQGCSTIRSFCAHGINQAFHAVPDIPHYAKNKAIGAAQPGMCFTLEPMIALGSYRDVCWPDNWTVTTRDGKLSAQFEHTLLVTETGVEVLTARLDDSPGGAEPFPR